MPEKSTSAELFFSKGSILEAAFASGGALALCWWLVASFTAFLTALYSFRLFYLVFLPPDDTVISTPDRPPLPLTMTGVLWPLGALALAGSLIDLPLGGGDGWLNRFIDMAGLTVENVHHSPAAGRFLPVLDTILALGGLFTAHMLFGRRPLPGREAEAIPSRGLLLFCRQGLGLDKLYGVLFVAPYRMIATFLWKVMDIRVVDFLVQLPGRILASLGGVCRLWSTGRLTTGLHSFLLGVCLMLVLVTLTIFGLW